MKIKSLIVPEFKSMPITKIYIVHITTLVISNFLLHKAVKNFKQTTMMCMNIRYCGLDMNHLPKRLIC
jgi:hypothetical protein